MGAAGRTRWRGLAAGLVIGALAAGQAGAEKDGIDSTLYYMGAIGCGGPQLEGEGCHVNPESDLVTVTIEGPSQITGSAELFTATAQTSIPGQDGSGINVLIDTLASTSDCQLDRFPTPEDDQLQFIGPVLSHRDAEVPPPIGSLGVFSYSFLLKDCTVPGTIRLLVAMNTFNGDGESTDDAWNQTERTITVPEPGRAAAGAALAGLLGCVAVARRRVA